MMMNIRSNGMRGLKGLGDQSVIDVITQAAQAQGVPVPLAIAQAEHESSLNPNATHVEVNGCIAYGLFQLEDCFFSAQGNLLDPVTNANVALGYLSQLKSKYGTWQSALMAYNEGPGNFEKGDQSSAGYAAAILAAANMTGGTTTPPVITATQTPAQTPAQTPVPAADAPAPAKPAAGTGGDLATLALLAVGGIVAVSLLT